MADSPSWRGIFPAICTPFAPGGGVDVAAQRAVVRFAVEHGAHGIVCFGLAGEVLKLSGDERRLLTDAILEEADGAVPILVGAGAESAIAACELARYAEQAGANGIVIPAPSSARPGPSALVDYLARVASSVSLPVMIQDAPAYLGVSLGPSVVTAAAERAGNIGHVKLEAGPVEMDHWLAELGDRFGVWGGDGGLYQLDCLRIGAAGIIPGVDLVDQLVDVYDAEAAGQTERADELFARILPMLVFEIQSIDHFNACAKHVLVRRGVLTHPALREPAQPFAEGSLRLLDRHLAALALGDRDARVSSAS